MIDVEKFWLTAGFITSVYCFLFAWICLFNAKLQICSFLVTSWLFNIQQNLQISNISILQWAFSKVPATSIIVEMFPKKFQLCFLDCFCFPQNFGCFKAHIFASMSRMGPGCHSEFRKAVGMILRPDKGNVFFFLKIRLLGGEFSFWWLHMAWCNSSVFLKFMDCLVGLIFLNVYMIIILLCNCACCVYWNFYSDVKSWSCPSINLRPSWTFR